MNDSQENDTLIHEMCCYEAWYVAKFLKLRLTAIDDLTSEDYLDLSEANYYVKNLNKIESD